MGELNNRANTPEQKREIIERLLTVWLAHPALRLGQLIENGRNPGGQLYYTEDYPLVEWIEEAAALWNRRAENETDK